VSERFVLGADWGARRESIEECANRLEAFFAEIVAHHDLLSLWYQKASDPKRSLEHLVDGNNRQMLIKILMKGQNRENVHGAVSEDLGFQVGFWNGQKGDDQASLTIRCGLYWKPSSRNISLGNCVVMDLPKSLLALSETERMVELLATTVRAWTPDWAGIMSESSMVARRFDAEKPFVDWMVYVPRRIRSVIEPASIWELQEGSIIVVQHTPPQSNELRSLALIERIEGIVEQMYQHKGQAT
jgi:Immunity protein 52